MSSPTSFPISKRNEAKRMRERASYDTEAIYALLDSALFCHIAYVVEGQPYCTPTIFWRRGNHVIWHGSAGSRMLRAQIQHIGVCLTVTFLDSLVLTRSAFAHAVNYRSVMLFGRASLIEDLSEKQLAARELLDTVSPGRSDLVIPPTPLELKQASFLKMRIEEASLKVRALPASHEVAVHRQFPVWAGEIPIQLRVGNPVPCTTLNPAIRPEPGLSGYQDGARLDEVLLRTRRTDRGKSSS